ncbi:hypothetical protein MKQ70_00785 [Chitinophaga sedimenti]|uniref:hypothetical protein n=1 Tax=Chitinophaga sedimenti TaxID=2033606 RepID=UPI00200586DE|nr:hypothetical protein [Chitinophaga sedimenti]MCK7553617.1 hypothetical protein [Chitinophaga sedimenti]
MKFGAARSIFAALALSLFPVTVFAQDSGRVRLLVRVYEDNDGIKFGRKIADGGYTNGTRLDVFTSISAALRSCWTGSPRLSVAKPFMPAAGAFSR